MLELPPAVLRVKLPPLRHLWERECLTGHAKGGVELHRPS